jgi:WD40 repeat protein
MLAILVAIMLLGHGLTEAVSGQTQEPLKPTLVLRGFRGSIQALALSPDGRTLAVADDSPAIRLFDIKDGRLTSRYEGHSGRVRAIALSSDGKLLAIGGEDRMLRLWDIDGHREVTSSIVPTCYSLAFSPDCKMLVAGCWDTSELSRFFGFYLLSLDGRVTKRVPISSAPITRLGFSQDGMNIALGAEYIYLYNVGTLQLKKLEGRHSGKITSVEIANENRWLISASYDHRLRIWDVASRREPFVLHEETESGCSDRILAATYIPTKKYIQTFSSDNMVRIWDFKRKMVIHRVLVESPLKANSFWMAEFSRDGSVLCAADLENTVFIFRYMMNRQ